MNGLEPAGEWNATSHAPIATEARQSLGPPTIEGDAAQFRQRLPQQGARVWRPCPISDATSDDATRAHIQHQRPNRRKTIAAQRRASVGKRQEFARQRRAHGDKRRQQVMAYPIAQVDAIRIRGIGDPGERVRRRVRLHVGSRQRQERSNDGGWCAQGTQSTGP